MNKRQAISFIGKHSKSPIGFQPMSFRSQLDPLTTDLHTTPGELGHVSWFYNDMHAAYTARIMSSGVIRNSVVRAFDWYTVVHRFESRRYLRFFTIVPCSGQTGRSCIIVHRVKLMIISFSMQVL